MKTIECELINGNPSMLTMFPLETGIYCGTTTYENLVANLKEINGNKVIIEFLETPRAIAMYQKLTTVLVPMIQILGSNDPFLQNFPKITPYYLSLQL